MASFGLMSGLEQAMQNPMFTAGLGLLSANRRGQLAPPDYAGSAMNGLMIGQQMRRQSQYDAMLQQQIQAEQAAQIAAQQEAQRKQQELDAAIATLPPEIQPLARANPTAFLKPSEQPKMTDDESEYMRAVSQGFTGSFMDYQEKVRSFSRPETNIKTTVNTEPDEMLDRYREIDVNNFAEAEKSAQSAFKANQAIDRFVASSASGDAGGAQPIITATKNFLASFGIEADSLKDTATMEAAIGEILGAKMAELGARGLTDKDMEILKAALPRVETSREAREAVAEILRRSNDASIQDYIYLREQRSSMYPDERFMTPRWLKEYQAPMGDVPEGVDPADWPHMTEEQRALWRKN